jgi:hypothetical protein
MQARGLLWKSGINTTFSISLTCWVKNIMTPIFSSCILDSLQQVCGIHSRAVQCKCWPVIT